MGAARIRLRARGQPRLWTLARLRRSIFAKGDARLRGLHRLGRRTTVEQRQGRPQRDFLLRDQSVAGSVAAAAAFGGDVRVGRSGGVVSRYFTSRRNLLHLLGKLVRHAGEDGAIRTRRARATKPR